MTDDEKEVLVACLQADAVVLAELQDSMRAMHQRMIELETLNDQLRIRVSNLEQVHDGT